MRVYFSVFGIAFLILAAFLLVRRLSAQIQGTSTLGRIRGHEQRKDDGSTFHLPIVEFTDTHGQVHCFTSVAGGSTKTRAVGSVVRVRYLPENPSVAYIQTFLHMWAAPLGCTALGIGALAVPWHY